MTTVHRLKKWGWSLRTLTIVAVALIAAGLLIPAAPDSARAIGVLDVFEHFDQGKNPQAIEKAKKLKKSLKKRWGNMLDSVYKATDIDALARGDKKVANEAFGEAMGQVAMIAVDYLDPTDGRIEKKWNKAKSIANKITQVFREGPDAVAEAKAEIGERLGSVRRRVGQTVDNARVALAVAPDEKAFYESGTGILDEKRPLPKPKRIHSVAATASASESSGWGTNDQAPAGRSSGWGNANNASSGTASTTQTGGDWGGTGSFDEWAIKEQEANPDCYGIVDANADCGTQATVEDHAASNADDEGRRNYEAALSDALGEEPGVSGDEDDYQGALSALEAKEEERKRQARLAEQRRLEQLERERQARLAEQRRIEREEQERQARLAGQRRREAEASSTYSSSNSSSSSRPTYNSGPSAGEILRQGLEALQESYRRAYERKSRAATGTFRHSSGFDYNRLTPDIKRR